MSAVLFMKPLQGALFIRMQVKILNLPASTSANIHRSVLEMRKNVRTKNPEDNKDMEDPEDQDPMNTGWKNNARVAGDSEEGSSNAEDKTKK